MKRGIVMMGVLALLLGAPSMVLAQRPLTIRLGVHGAVQGAPDVIAIRQGFFKQERLEVDWRRFGVGREGRDAMIAGAIDINATATTPFLIGLEKGVRHSEHRSAQREAHCSGQGNGHRIHLCREDRPRLRSQAWGLRGRQRRRSEGPHPHSHRKGGRRDRHWGPIRCHCRTRRACPEPGRLLQVRRASLRGDSNE